MHDDVISAAFAPVISWSNDSHCSVKGPPFRDMEPGDGLAHLLELRPHEERPIERDSIRHTLPYPRLSGSTTCVDGDSIVRAPQRESCAIT